MDELPAGLISCAGTRTGLAGGDPARLAPAARAAIAAACGVPARSNLAGVSCRIASGTGADLLSGTAGMGRQLSGRGGSRRPLAAASRTRGQQTAGSLPAFC